MPIGESGKSLISWGFAFLVVISKELPDAAKRAQAVVGRNSQIRKELIAAAPSGLTFNLQKSAAFSTKIALCPHKAAREDVIQSLFSKGLQMRKRKEAVGAKPRGSCTVCHQGFAKATDAQFRQRWAYHLMSSERHKKYLALQTPQSGNS